MSIKCSKSHACPASGVDSNGGTDSTMESVPVPTPVISYKPDSDSSKKLEPPHPYTQWSDTSGDGNDFDQFLTSDMASKQPQNGLKGKTWPWN